MARSSPARSWLPVLAFFLAAAGPGALRAQLPNPAGTARPVPADHDGDGRTDMAIKGSNGTWYLDLAANGFGGRWDRAFFQYGGATAIAVPADYDGDGKADLAVKDATGMWGIDYAANHFGVFDWQGAGYGDSAAVPVPADYDGDGKADLAVKNAGGQWLIDLAVNGFLGWDLGYNGYGGASAVPVPADYDGDRRADLAVKDGTGAWLIDFAWNGFGAWNQVLSGYGGSTAVPVPADYDNDGRADLAVKDAGGTWLVDYAAGGFGGWNASFAGRGGSTVAAPGDYDGDRRLDLAVKDTGGVWLVDLASDGFGGWNLQVANSTRVNLDLSAPWIDAVEIWGPAGRVLPVNGQFPVTIGVRYHVALHIDPGNGQYTAGVEINPDLFVPHSLQVQNRVGTTGHVRITQAHTRRFAFTPSEPGSFPLGFMMRDIGPPTGTGLAFNQDYGIRLACTAQRQGLYGTVTTRVQLANGRFTAGSPIGNASVAVGNVRTTTASDGSWALPGITGSGHRLTITAAGFSPTLAVNVTVPPGSGVRIDTPLEEPFTPLAARGMSYTTYLDYSRGRTILHVVRMPTATAIAKVEVAAPNNTFPRLTTIAGNLPNALAVINGGYFDVSGGYGSVGYFWSRGPIASQMNLDTTPYPTDPPTGILEPSLIQPMLTIAGLGTGQAIDIQKSEAKFLATTSLQWRQVGVPSRAIWDVAPRDGVSDVDYALQCTPLLLHQGAVIWRGEVDTGSYYRLAWARTAVGVAPGVLFLVVADGEGVNGGQGATFHQLGEFFRDVLGARSAMNFDGGLSTEMVLRSAHGVRKVNTLTGEDSSWDIDPWTSGITESDGGPGSVFNYLRAGGS